MGKRWVPLESNPAVINDYIAHLGAPVEQIGFRDVYGVDPELLAMVPQPVKAVIMLFPITDETEAAKSVEELKVREAGESLAEGVWFTKQTVSNACGTVGVLHALGNTGIPFSSGSFLEQFFSISQDMTPEERARLLEDPQEGEPDLEKAHQNAAIAGQSAAPADGEEVLLHFVCFVHVNGLLYELDGRKIAPISHGPTTAHTLLADACSVAKTLMDATDNIRFSLMALVPTQAESCKS
eukprot:jgi/Ulvmu1/11570/UM079_0013.1